MFPYKWLETSQYVGCSGSLQHPYELLQTITTKAKMCNDCSLTNTISSDVPFIFSFFIISSLTSVLGHWPFIPFSVWQHFMQLDQLWPQPHPKKSSLQISLMLEIYDNKDLQITPGPVG